MDIDPSLSLNDPGLWSDEESDYAQSTSSETEEPNPRKRGRPKRGQVPSPFFRG